MKRPWKVLAMCFLMSVFAAVPAVAAQDSPPEMVSRVIPVKHRTPSVLVEVVRLLASTEPRAMIQANDEFRTITVRDLPEKVQAIEQTIVRLDTPDRASPDVEFTLYVLIASNDGAQASVPADLKDTVSRLGATLNYKTYNLVSTSIHRINVRSGGLSNEGNFEIRPSIMQRYRLNMGRLSAVDSGADRISVGHFSYEFLSEASALPRLSTSFEIRAGEKVVLGTAGMRERALILVVTYVVK